MASGENIYIHGEEEKIQRRSFHREFKQETRRLDILPLAGIQQRI